MSGTKTSAFYAFYNKHITNKKHNINLSLILALKPQLNGLVYAEIPERCVISSENPLHSLMVESLVKREIRNLRESSWRI